MSSIGGKEGRVVLELQRRRQSRVSQTVRSAYHGPRNAPTPGSA